MTNESIYLVHSDSSIAGDPLGAIFAPGHKVLHTKYWSHAYPVQRPEPTPANLPPIVLGNGALYMNSIESVASSMETTAISARNAARLLQ